MINPYVVSEIYELYMYMELYITVKAEGCGMERRRHTINITCTRICSFGSL